MKVVVDGVALDLAPGTSAIDAVFAAGSDVPYFCSQEYMSPIGACRMCLAKVGAPRKDRDGSWILDEATGEPKVFWFPNLMATCTTAVMEGMVIDTRSEPVKFAQNGMVEFTLINHPLDCPTCDKGGACELQDRAYEYGTGHSRFVFDKRHQEKHHALSDLITLDRERCIHCKRCVRYFEEVPGDEVLDFIERGGHTYIGTLEDGLPSNFTGNITDICPVGALLDATSRFRGRNWEYAHTATTSLDDASGSAIVVDARTGRVERIKSGHHPQINKTWIDDGTRFGHEYADAPDRLKRPLVRRGDELVEATWAEAMAVVQARLEGIAGKDVAIALRADATLEEGVAARALADHFGSGRLDHAPRPAGGVIAPNGNAKLEELATADAILVVADATEEVPIVDLRVKDALKGVAPAPLFAHGAPIADLRLKERMPRRTGILTVAAPFRVDLMRSAGRAATYPANGEAAFFRALAELAEDAAATPDAAALGMPLEDARATVAGLAAGKNAVVVLGGWVLADAAATAAAYAFCRAVGAKPMPLGPMANSHGLESIGVLPSHARYGYAGMLAGDAQALLISNLDPAVDAMVAERLKGLELLVVHAAFRTATAELAHVVRPAATGYEKDGTVVNLEGRMLPVRAAPIDGGEATDLTGVVKALGEALGTRLEGRSVRSARRFLKKSVGVDLDALPDLGSMLPHKRAVAAPKATATAPAPAPASGGLRVPTMVRPEVLGRNPHLLAATGGLKLRLHPKDAARAGVHEGDVVTVPVDRTRRTLVVQVTEAVPEGLATVPATPDEPVGAAHVDLAKVAVERRALQVA
jgi:NADH-quinone oxidoreductase subunit G